MSIRKHFRSLISNSKQKLLCLEILNSFFFPFYSYSWKKWQTIKKENSLIENTFSDSLLIDLQWKTCPPSSGSQTDAMISHFIHFASVGVSLLDRSTLGVIEWFCVTMIGYLFHWIHRIKKNNNSSWSEILQTTRRAKHFDLIH